MQFIFYNNDVFQKKNFENVADYLMFNAQIFKKYLVNNKRKNKQKKYTLLLKHDFLYLPYFIHFV